MGYKSPLRRSSGSSILSTEIEAAQLDSNCNTLIDLLDGGWFGGNTQEESPTSSDSPERSQPTATASLSRSTSTGDANVNNSIAEAEKVVLVSQDVRTFITACQALFERVRWRDPNSPRGTSSRSNSPRGRRRGTTPRAGVL